MEGPKGLISKKRGKKSNRAVPDERRKEIVRVIRDNDLGCRPLFISEKLRERQNLKYSSEFIRQLMAEYHQLWLPKRARRKLHQRRKKKGT